jgi:hypothetical protein
MEAVAAGGMQAPTPVADRVAASVAEDEANNPRHTRGLASRTCPFLLPHCQRRRLLWTGFLRPRSTSSRGRWFQPPPPPLLGGPRYVWRDFLPPGVLAPLAMYICVSHPQELRVSRRNVVCRAAWDARGQGDGGGGWAKWRRRDRI